MRRESRNPTGAIAVQMVVSLTAVVLFLALLVDGGNVLSERRRAQAAADAAALAGASDLFLNYPVNQGQDPQGTARASALSNAAVNGFSNNGTDSLVTVNIPPQSGAFQNASQYPGYIEVIVQANVGRIFSPNATPVIARAVARGQWAPAHLGVLVLSPQANPAVTLSGSASINVSGGASVVVNSSGAKAVSMSGGGITVASPGKTWINGGWSGSGFNPAPSHSAPVPDPLRFLPAPVASSLPTISAGTLTISSTPAGGITLSPGVYGGIAVNGSSTVNLLPGIYYMAGGGFTITGGSVTGKGVMIYNGPNSTGSVGAFSINGPGAMTLTPPTSGPYTGISFFQARGATKGAALTGSGALNISGTLYAPSASLTLTGSGGSTSAGSQVIASTLTLTGSGNINVSFDPRQAAPTRIIGLVE